jgi:hypothetical protein
LNKSDICSVDSAERPGWRMFRCKNVADQLESQGVAHLAQGTNPEAFEAFGVNRGHAAVSAGGDEIRVVKAVIPGRAGHGRIVIRSPRIVG